MNQTVQMNNTMYSYNLELLYGRNWPLTSPARKVEKMFGDLVPGLTLQSLISQMEKKLRYETNGIGIAATQLGVPYQVLIFDKSDPKDIANTFEVAINPEIDMSQTTNLEEETQNEGCLSFPSVFVPVSRLKTITVKYINIYGGIENEILTGLPARIFQHELNHLQGKFFFSEVLEKRLVSRQFRRQLERDLEKLDQRGKEYSDRMRKMFGENSE